MKKRLEQCMMKVHNQEVSMPEKESIKHIHKVKHHGPWGFFHLLAFIGAAIYFISQSDGSFWGVILGLLQAFVWPVYVVYNGLLALGA